MMATASHHGPAPAIAPELGVLEQLAAEERADTPRPAPAALAPSGYFECLLLEHQLVDEKQVFRPVVIAG